MSFSIAPLLVHGAYVPAEARDAIREALVASSGSRRSLLKAAARILHREAEVDCADALELVGLEDAGCGG
jgi:hypothetical protein